MNDARVADACRGAEVYPLAFPISLPLLSPCGHFPSAGPTGLVAHSSVPGPPGWFPLEVWEVAVSGPGQNAE